MNKLLEDLGTKYIKDNEGNVLGATLNINNSSFICKYEGGQNADEAMLLMLSSIFKNEYEILMGIKEPPQINPRGEYDIDLLANKPNING